MRRGSIPWRVPAGVALVCLLGLASAGGQRRAEVDYWEVESARVRANLPGFDVIPAAEPGELTEANGHPVADGLMRWHRSHGGDGSTRFSPLDQINRGNVDELAVAWTFRAGGAANIQCNPVVARGMLFVPVPGGDVVALDAATGEEKWRFDPGVDGAVAWRGITFWPGETEHGARLLFCAGDDLVVLDPGDGSVLRKIRVGHFRVAPVVFDGAVIVAGFAKDVFAFDLVTGEPRWKFHTVPRDGEFGADTWDRPSEEGANCWGGTSLDRERGFLFLATGSPKPNFFGVQHRGRNLFANSIIALDARTGKRVWHFQEVPHDIWDLDIPSPPVLVEVVREGKRVDAVAALSKTGNTLLLDRVTGKPLFPFRVRRAPTSTLPGEKTWPYQPAPELPEPFCRQTFTVDDVTDISVEAQNTVLEKTFTAKKSWMFDTFENGRPSVYFGIHGGAEWTGGCFDPSSGRIYVSSNEIPWVITLTSHDDPPVDETTLSPTPGREIYLGFCVGCHGPNRFGSGVNPGIRSIKYRLEEDEVIDLIEKGRNLMPPAAHIRGREREDLLDYLFDRDRPPPPAPRGRPERPRYRFGGFSKLLDHEGYPGCKPPWGTLNCLDLNTGKLVWKVALGEHAELTARGVPKTGTENFGGPTVTAGGLVFCAGTRDDKIRAFDAATGDELWEHALPFCGSAPPTVYAVGGKQFVVVPATGGGKLGRPAGDAFVAFALP